MPVVNSVKKFLRYQSAVKFHMKNVRKVTRTSVEKLQEMFLTRLQNTDVSGQCILFILERLYMKNSNAESGKKKTRMSHSVPRIGSRQQSG